MAPRYGQIGEIIMRRKLHRISTIVILTSMITFIFVCNSQADKKEGIKWNHDANSLILNKNKLEVFNSLAESWKLKQMIWPSETEITGKRVNVNEELKHSCTTWLGKFLKTELLPTDINKHLVAMSEWGLVSKESEQKRLCDVFIARFKKGPYVIHIQESLYNIIISVSDERLANTAQANHKDLVIEIGKTVLSKVLEPIPASENFHVFEFASNGKKITRVSWAIEPVKVIKDGKSCIDPYKAGEIGTTYVEAETDGRFVRFEIIKSPGAVNPASYDPYIERFGAKGNK
jgi:hypothetical protein